MSGPAGVWQQQQQAGGGEEGEEADGAEADNEKLRRYELSRCRYYYGVVVCDSVATAEHLYAECDGAEFEYSAKLCCSETRAARAIGRRVHERCVSG